MDVVTDAGSVGRIVIVAIDRQAFQLAAGDSGNIGQQVVRDTVGFFTDQSRGMCTDGVEVTKQSDRPFLVRYTEILEDHLDHQFGGAIGVGGREGEVFPDGQRSRGAINGCRRGEDDLLNIVLPHLLAEDDGAGQVVVIVFQRFLDTLTNRLESGEVDNRVDIGVFVKNFFYALFVQQVDLIEFEILAVISRILSRT